MDGWCSGDGILFEMKFWWPDVLLFLPEMKSLTARLRSNDYEFLQIVLIRNEIVAALWRHRQIFLEKVQ